MCFPRVAKKSAGAASAAQINGFQDKCITGNAQVSLQQPHLKSIATTDSPGPSHCADKNGEDHITNRDMLQRISTPKHF